MLVLAPGRHPIRAVSKLTGVPVDTLRAWERRYRVVEPQRDGRGRMYTDGDVRKLKLLRALVERGHPIGRLAQLSEGDLVALHGQAFDVPRAEGRTGGAEVDAVLAALERFDGAAAERELTRLATLLSPRQLVREVALPLMRRVGDEWFAGRLSPAQEHLASAALRNLLGALVRVHARQDPPVTLLFATPAGERHEFGVLAAAMLAAGGGLGALYLGPDLPASEIAAAARRAAVRMVVLGIAGAGGASEFEKALRDVAAALPRGVDLWVGGPQLPDVAAAVRASGGSWLPDFDAYERRLLALGARF